MSGLHTETKITQIMDFFSHPLEEVKKKGGKRKIKRREIHSGKGWM